MIDLTPESVRKKIQEISDSNDKEIRHSDEDELHMEFFRQLASGALNVDEARDMAAEFLTLKYMERWYA